LGRRRFLAVHKNRPREMKHAMIERIVSGLWGVTMATTPKTNVRKRKAIMSGVW